MLSDTMQNALNKQMNREMFAGYLYFAAAADLESKSLNGFAQWMKAQTQEEMTHALRFYHFINERGGRAVMQPIEAPPAEFASVLDAFKAAYEHETKVSNWINELVALAREEKDFAAENFLQWFVAEQVEEEAQTDEAVRQLERAGDGPALFMLDQKYGARVFAMPPDLAGALGGGNA